MKATIESAGGVASRLRLGEHELTFDQPSSVPGGEDRGPSPLDVFAAAAGACAHYFAAAFLYGRKLSTAGLTVTVEAEKTKDPVPRLGTLKIRVLVPAGVSAEHLAGIERAVRHCPAYGTLTHPAVVELDVGVAAVSATAA